MIPTRHPMLRVPFSVSHRKLGALYAAAMAVVLGLNPAQAQTAAASSPAAPAAPAAEQPAVKVEEGTIRLDKFVVTGIRGSMTEALNIKRDSVQMVDAVVAEDIGKFPDNNIVEALQRVPGVQITDRGAGQISTVTIRGLNDVSTTINGRNVFTASGLSLSLPDIPASLLNRVDVYKTRSADMVETGLAGQIDIHTHRPFDFAGDAMGLAARGIYRQQAGKYDTSVSGLMSKRWNTSAGKFGALVNVSYSITNYRDESVTPGAQVPFVTGTSPSGWVPYERIFPTDGRVTENPIWQAGLNAGLPAAAGSTLPMNGVAVPYVLSRDAIFASDARGKTKRPAANLSLQFAPNADAEYTFEVFYDGYRNENFNNLLFSFVDWWGGPLGAVTLYPGTNIVKKRDSVGWVYGFNSGDLTTGKTDSYVVGLTGKWNINSDFKLKADASYQTSKYNQTFFAMRTDRVAPSIAVDFNAGGGLPAFSFPDNSATTTVNESDLTNPALWNIAQLYDQAHQRKGSAGTLTVDGDYKVDWGIVKTLKFGVRYDDRKAAEAQIEQDAAGLGQNLATHPELAYTNSNFFDGRAAVPTTWVVANGYYIDGHKDTIRNLYNSTIASTLKTGAQFQMTENFNVDEATTSGYAMADFKTIIGDRKLDGQFGARFVSVTTDMAFSGQSSSVSKSKVLPSMMVRYDLTNDLRLRLAYGETLRRPAFTDLNPIISYVKDVTNIGYGTASGGNPNLKPTEAKNYDLSLEYYLDDASGLFATAFKREIDGLVVGFRRRVTYQNYDYILSQPDNASNGKLDGFEFGGTYFPKNLPDPLKGFGVQASYTILKSSQDIPITNSAGVVVGTENTKFFAVSNHSYSAVLAYERSKFSARLSYEWRASFLHHNEAALFANPLGVYNKAERNLNFQMSYRVTDKISLTFDATNLTNEIYQSYYGNLAGNSTTNNFGSSIYGRTYALGARFSF
jgi:TonB-dependent receptor